MSSEADSALDSVAPAASAGAALSAGMVLRGAREKAGLHIAALSVALKVPVNKLEALEADRFDLLPDFVFARALAASVCRTLKLDPAPVLGMLPEQTPRLQIGARISAASFDSPQMGWQLPVLSKLPRPVVVMAGLLLVAALAMFFLPSLEPANPAPAPGAPAHDSSKPLGQQGPTTAPPAPAFAAASAPPSPSAVVAAVAASQPTVRPAATVSASASQSAADQNEKAGAPGSDAAPLVFKTRGTSWVQVTDASGVVQLRRTLANGETVAVSGTLPMSVVVGRVDSIDVVVRGKSFDLAPFAKDNTARFQIK